MTRDELLDKLIAVKSELSEKFGIEQIALFGSYARDEATEQSDIDLTIVKMKKKDYFMRAKAIYFLEKQLGKKVDMGYFDSIRTTLRHQIKQDMIYV